MELIFYSQDTWQNVSSRVTFQTEIEKQNGIKIQWYITRALISFFVVGKYNLYSEHGNRSFGVLCDF